MPKTEKIEKVAELKERIQGAQALFLADFRGLTVTESGELRRSLSGAGAKFTVVKNTLMKRAVADAGASELERLLEGPTAVAFVDGDPIAAAKSLADATRKFRTLVVKGGFLEGRVLSPEEAQSLATIEPREVLLAKMAGLAKAEMSRAAFMFNALQSRFVALLEAYREKLPGGAPAEEESQEAQQPAVETVEQEEPASEAPAAVEPAPEAEAGAEGEAETTGEEGDEAGTSLAPQADDSPAPQADESDTDESDTQESEEEGS